MYSQEVCLPSGFLRSLPSFSQFFGTEPGYGVGQAPEAAFLQVLQLEQVKLRGVLLQWQWELVR